ncbi:beta-glucan synthesis-associated protein-domain-containing protein [Morchella snyderi]|nr:beta-glucan synthesis-associated protein-domain-containing protein [Morchella snyderi]
MSARPSPPPTLTLNSGSQDLLNGAPARRASVVGRNLTPQVPSPTVSRSQSPFYQGDTPIESSELLIPPQRRPGQFTPYQDSPTSSRRSSWSTDNRDSRYGPFVSPFDDNSGTASPDIGNALNSQTISEKYNITPSAGLLLFPMDKEDDDALHDPAELDDLRECDVFTRRGLVNVGGLGLIVLGILVLFIGYPVLTFVRDATKVTKSICEGPLCLDVGPIALLQNVRSSLIDPDTPESALTKTSADGKTFRLVFSDEFNQDGRTFYPNDDPYWEGVDIHYAATQDSEWYDPDALTTKDGVLEIEFAAFRNHDLDFRSGMLQSWNKLCFKGGIIEASISLPGAGNVSGLWPGFWTMGNLGRPGYLSTTEGMWPYSYHDECDAGITANQSSPDGLSWLPGMKLPGCTCSGEDHPNAGKARSSPELDILEATVSVIDTAGNIVGAVSQSAQVAPFDIWYQPDYEQIAVYNPDITVMNSYRGGYYQEAISGYSTLNNDWYDGKQYQTYGFEYEPGNDGKIVWNIGEVKTWEMLAGATGPNGNIGQRPIPQEPMTIIVNVGMSSTFAYINWAELAKLLPAKMRIDWIRVWQDEDCADCSVTCDPPGYPSTKYIEDHIDAYMNPNLTNWAATGYDWPQNTLVDGCSA